MLLRTLVLKDTLPGKRVPGPKDLNVGGNADTPTHFTGLTVHIDVLKALRCLVLKTSLMLNKNPRFLNLI